jgi:hypothetical protein
MWKPVFYIFFTLFTFCLSGLLSMIYNEIPIQQAFLGIFDYIKNFLPIILLPAIPFSRMDLNKLYSLLLKLAIFLVLIGILQEILWILNISVPYLGEPIENRFGFWRVPSLLGHPNLLGLYSILFFVLNYSLCPKLNRVNLLLLAGILLSGSKFIWGATLVFLFIFALRKIHFSLRIKAKKLILCLTCLTIILMISPYLYQKSLQDFSPHYYRGYALKKSLEIWNDHLMLGSGPGTYGGVVSLMYNSSVYDQYNFESRWFDFMQGPRSLDQFWPQCLAEMGILGFISFATLILLLFWLPRKILHKISDPDLQLFLSGPSSLVIVLIIYLCVSGLNMTSFILTYSILLGMCLSVVNPLNPLNRSTTNECPVTH